MGLRDLNIKTKYKNLSQNLVDSFYTPVLNESVIYNRAVGFFSSNTLVDYIKGLKTFINNNGRMKLIISPYMTESDIQTTVRIFNRFLFVLSAYSLIYKGRV